MEKVIIYIINITIYKSQIKISNSNRINAKIINSKMNNNKIVIKNIIMKQEKIIISIN